MHSHTAAASSSPSHHYQYDDAGNRTSVLDLGVTTSYGAANSVNAYTSISGSAAPVYDDNGNMTSGPLGVAGAASSALTYGKENNNLLSATGAQATNFVYDAIGRLVQFSYTENSVTKTEILTWAGWTLMTREIFTENAVSETFRYTWGSDLSGTLEGAGLPAKVLATAGGVGGLLAVERNIAGSSTWDIRYTHADANGNIIALTNNSGAVSARYRYDAFGKVLSATDVDASGWVNHNIHGFSSKPSFGKQGLLYYGYRWYSPSLGRWINRDPIEEKGGMNLYGFVGNDGISKIDIMGNSWWDTTEEVPCPPGQTKDPKCVCDAIDDHNRRMVAAGVSAGGMVAGGCLGGPVGIIVGLGAGIAYVGIVGIDSYDTMIEEINNCPCVCSKSI